MDAHLSEAAGFDAAWAVLLLRATGWGFSLAPERGKQQQEAVSSKQ